MTPDGRLSRYFYGVEYSPKELRLALVESGEGQIGSAIDELLLYCFHYDPESGRYGVVVMNLVRLGGVMTVLAIAGFILVMRRREVAIRRRVGRETVTTMLSGIPLFPEQASTLAPEVDNLYFFVMAVTAFFALLVVFLVIVFAVKYRDDTGQKVGAPITGFHVRSSSDGRSSRSSSRWRSSSGRRSSSSTWCAPLTRRSRSIRPASGGCGGSSTSTARARSTSCTCRSAARSR